MGSETRHVVVDLPTEKRHLARVLADRRHARAVAKQRGGKYGGATDGKASVRLHMIGTLGEFAVAYALGLPDPDSVDTFKSVPDLPPDIEVRTRTKASYELMVRPDDFDDRRYVLVNIDLTVRPAALIVRGWMLGSVAKQPAWSKAHGGRPSAYFVPNDALWHLDGLRVYADRTPVVTEIFR